MDATLSKELRKLALEIRIGIVEQIQARGFGHIGGSLSLADAPKIPGGRTGTSWSAPKATPVPPYTPPWRCGASSPTRT